MVSRRIFVSCALVVLALTQVGCCCHRRHVFRVQNSACCCAPAPRTACCEPVHSYKRFGGGFESMAEPPMTVMPQAVIQPQGR
jgi:hypothetical protein